MNSDHASSFETKLGFDVIREMISGYCLSHPGREKAARMAFSTDRLSIAREISETAEMKSILSFEENFPSQDYYDLVPELIRVRIPGTYMEPATLSEMKLSMATISRLLRFLGDRSDSYPFLHRLSTESAREDLSPLLDYCVKRIEAVVDEKSEVRDSASAELGRIRKEKQRLLSSVEQRIRASFKTARQSGWTPDDAEVTIRNGRLVIPLVHTHKRKIPGFVHDESATGQTVYVEPADIFETNNEIRELDYAERREIIRILTEFAAALRPHADDLVRGYRFLGSIDFIRAKALFALEVNGNKPLRLPGPATPKEEENALPAFSWRQAVHPLLFLSLRRQGRNIVPLDIGLNPDQRILIISGPNAGGKSVCLKTAGLVQYMFQCGLLPTAREDSEFCIFQKIFIDIGDEQSIDNDLSTYSSKLINLKSFLESVDPRSLFLIDEMGTGTDPSLGGAIAEATLEALNRKKAMGVVTTHYSNLKLLAAREPGIFNGAMLYDLKRLKPLYQLKTGKPGSSFAFEIAREIGFPGDVLRAAQEKTGRSQLDFDRELQNLEVEKEQIDRKNTELQVADEFLTELIGKYEKLTSDLESKKKEILEKAREEARELLSQSNRIIEKTVREIREAHAEKERTKAIRAGMEKAREEILNPVVKPEKPATVKKDSAGPGTLHQPPANKEKSQLPVITKDMIGSKAAPPRYQKYIDDMNERLNSFSLTLDLRGYTVEEAIPALQRYIDDAVLFSIPEIRILHGKGNGVLRQITRDYLRSQKEVRSARDAPVESGGAGITVVSFR